MKTVRQRLYWLSAAALAMLLAVAAFTGAIHAFYYELDEWLNPGFYRTQTEGAAMHPAALIEKLEAAMPIEVWYLQVPDRPNRSAMLAVSPRHAPETGLQPDLQNNYFYMNPVSGKIVGARRWGECCFEPKNLLNYFYELHHSLTISGAIGSQLMGVVASVWLISCVMLLGRALLYQGGFALLGLSRSHTAILCVLMLPIALSSVAMNFPAQLFKPVVSLFSPVKPSIYETYTRKPQTDFGRRNLSYKEAFELAAELGEKRGWSKPIGELFYSGRYNFYGMAFGQRDPRGMGNNWLYLSAVDGTLINAKTPGEGSSGDQFYFAQLPLHSGRALGPASQLFIFLMGMVIALVSICVAALSLRRACGRNRPG